MMDRCKGSGSSYILLGNAVSLVDSYSKCPVFYCFMHGAVMICPIDMIDRSRQFLNLCVLSNFVSGPIVTVH